MFEIDNAVLETRTEAGSLGGGKDTPRTEIALYGHTSKEERAFCEKGSKPLLRLIVSKAHVNGRRAPSYEARLDGELICISAQPLLDGARELLGRGYNPETLLTSRWQGKGYDSFRPEKIGYLAQWTIVEGDSGMHWRKYVAYPTDRVAP